MAQKNEGSTGGGYGLPILAVASLVAAWFGNREEPFVLTRGQDSSQPDATRLADRESRLWHDPLDKTRVGDRKSYEESVKPDKALLITVPSTHSLEDVESRGRSRQALHSAMTACGFEPVDATQMQFVDIRVPLTAAPQGQARGTDVIRGDTAKNEASKRESPEKGTPVDATAARDKGELPIPVEVFTSPTTTARIVAFWLPERELQQHFSTQWAIEASLQLGPYAKKSVLIGPSSTHTLDNTYLGGLTVHSPWVTARDITKPGLLDRLYHWGRNPTRRSFLCTDSLLAQTLEKELGRRGIAGPGEVLLVMERDSSFARSWREHLAKAWHQPIEREGKPTFFEAWYSRGIDGGSDPSAKNKPAIETPTGLGTMDYLRRLRHEFARTKDTVSAVGVFGQDIHDKLLIIQALQPVFTDALFFTSDLDAYYSHPTQLPHTRNLLVASGHGLLPHEHEHHEDPTPSAEKQVHLHADAGILTPFRDSYQTSTYLALHEAICGHEVGHPTNGLTFEIGNHGPVQLDTWLSPGWSLFPWLWLGLALFAMLLGSGLVHWQLRRGLAKEQAIDSGPKGPWYVATLSVITLGVAVWLAALLSAEPANWLDGVSAWPTEVLRFFALCLALVFSYHVIRALRQPAENAPEHNAVPVVVDAMGAIGQVLGAMARSIPVAWLPRDSQAFSRLASPWRWLASPGPTRQSSVNRMCASASLLALLLAGFGAIVMVATGAPNVPIRGGVARALDLALLLSSVLAMLWLVFLVVEVAHQFVKICRTAEKNLPFLHSAGGHRVREWRAQRQFLLGLAEAGGKGIYGPFIVILILCLSLWRGFDDWTWPLGLRLIVGISVACVVLAHIHLQRVATGLRDHSIRDLKRAIEETTDKEQLTGLGHVLKDLTDLQHGIFAGLGGHPVMRGLVIPFTGIGGLTLLQWL